MTDDCGLRYILASRHHVYLLNTLPIRQRITLQLAGLGPASIVWAFHSEASEVNAISLYFVCIIFSFAVPSGSGAFQMPTHPSAASAATLRGGRANLRNAAVTFSLFFALSFFGMTLITYHKKDLVESL